MPAGAVLSTPEVDLTESGDSFAVNAGIDGMGRLMYQAVFSRDYNVAMGVLVPAAALTMLGNFLADIGYALADPRVRLR